MSDSLVYPLHYLLVERCERGWVFKPGDAVFYNPRNVPVSLNLDDRLARFRLTPAKIMIELFRLRGGKAGHYLVNLRDRRYYYCGEDREDIRTTLQSIGIGKPEPEETR
jgi:hypothetical protein